MNFQFKFLRDVLVSAAAAQRTFAEESASEKARAK